MSAPHKLASEYLTDDEMATKFKRPAKKVKKDRASGSKETRIRSRIIDDGKDQTLFPFLFEKLGSVSRDGSGTVFM